MLRFKQLQELTTLRILEVGGIEAEAPQLKPKPQWWQLRKAAAGAEQAAGNVT